MVVAVQEPSLQNFVCHVKVMVFSLQVYFGTQHAKIYLTADLLGINCVTGMSCLFRRSVLDEAGGLKSLGQYLAEDYYLGKIFFDKYVLEHDLCVCLFLVVAESVISV